MFQFHKPNSSNKKKKKQATSSSQPSSAPSNQRACYNCGSLDHLLRSCPKSRICRYFKKEGHWVSDCPIAPKGFKSGKLNVAKASGDSSQPKGITPSVLEGFILFHGRSIRVLFDTGASHSFVSKELVDIIHSDVITLCDPLRIINPIGGSATLGLLCVDVEIILCGFSFHANLHVMDHLGFDMILGMDWLVRYEVQILCLERTLYLKHPDAIEQLYIVFRDMDHTSNALISSFESENAISNIPVVCDFSDVFEPISCLPPKRAIEFRIDLISGAHPVSRPPTRMSAKENEELKQQLSELEAKHFIRSSSSPWVIAVVFVKKPDGTLRLCIDYR